METNKSNNEVMANKSVVVGIVTLVVFLIALIAVGMFCLKEPEATIQGQADATTVRVSGKLIGRVAEFYVEEGDMVKAGDTLVRIYSSTTDAQLVQARAAQTAAKAQASKADAGTRAELKTSAEQLWHQAQAAETITKKTYERMENLFKQGVVSEQKRDEAQAAYTAAKAQAAAAKSQYDMACKGLQAQDKQAANAMSEVAHGNVMQVESLLEDQYLVAPCDGEIIDIFPNIGELVMAGAPIMSILRDDTWVAFSVREEKLAKLTMGTEIKTIIPALDNKEVTMKIYHLRDMGSYSIWNATKATGSYDSKTFQVKARPTTPVEGLRPGMSVILIEE